MEMNYYLIKDFLPELKELRIPSLVCYRLEHEQYSGQLGQ